MRVSPPLAHQHCALDDLLPSVLALDQGYNVFICAKMVRGVFKPTFLLRNACGMVFFSYFRLRAEHCV